MGNSDSVRGCLGGYSRQIDMSSLVLEHIEGTQSHIKRAEDKNFIQVGQKHTFGIHGIVGAGPFLFKTEREKGGD